MDRLSPYPAFAPPPAARREGQFLDRWLHIQGVNLIRHARSLRAFARDEFGTTPASPGEAHIEAVNTFIGRLRGELVERARQVEAAATMARREPTGRRLSVVLARKQRVAAQVLFLEGIWDFYFDMFVQRLSVFGERLRTIDRIAANCYEDVYIGLGTAQPTPTLLPFSYADSGFSPYTFRRGVPLQRLRHNPNLFPLIVLPQHRLDNVWSLSSVLHEVSHNLQADLGLWEAVPARIFAQLTAAGRLSDAVARVWAGWHKEMVADMLALLLGGPASVESLMDVVGRSRAATLAYSSVDVHPTPYLRVLINLVLLRRMGLIELADKLSAMWRRLYPAPLPPTIPAPILRTFDVAAELAVDAMVFQPYRQLAGKSLAQIIVFGSAEAAMIEQAGRRLAAGHDPGPAPLRLMVGAARYALDQQLAAPQTITDHFYRTLGRR
jgi:hypothetical protein